MRGEPGHAIVPECAPRGGELVVDKPGFSAFYKTDLEARLRARGVARRLWRLIDDLIQKENKHTAGDRLLTKSSR